MEKVITTKLINRELEFMVLTVAETLRLPCLLVGPVGTGKTQIFLDFVSSSDGNSKVFMKQLTYDTRSDEILGHIDIQAYKEGRIERQGSIADADYVLIDEVDKATSQVRNLLLSAMRERAIFDGVRLKKCRWKLFVGTSNRSRLFDEDDQGFLDRFVLKVKVDRIGGGFVPNLLRLEERTVQIIPKHEPDLKLINKKLVEVLTKYYNKVSDRTITMALKVALEFARYCETQEAIVRTLEYLVSPEVALECADKFTE